MKKIFGLIIIATFALGEIAYSQRPVYNPSVVEPATSPAAGACTAQIPLQVFGGVLYSCQAGAWTSVGGSGTFNALSGDATSTATGGATTVVGLNNVILSTLTTGILKNTTATGKPSIAVAGTDYVLPSGNITGTAGNVTGIVAAANGGTGVANAVTLTLGTAAQNWATLGTGIVKNTTTTGAISDAASSDVIGLWTGTCSSTTYLNGAGACTTPSGTGTINGGAQYDLPYYSAAGTATTLSGAAVTGIPYINAAAPTAATSANVIALWTGTCSSSTYLNGAGACATPAGSGTINAAAQYSMPYYSATGSASTLSGVANGLTGQTLVSTNGSGPAWKSAGLAEGNGGAPVTTTYTVQCDSATAVLDRGTVINFTGTAATTITLPDPTTTGCGNNFALIITNDGTATVTVSRTTTATFTVANGSSVTNSATSFSLPAGSFVSINSPDNANWLARLNTAAAGNPTLTLANAGTTGTTTSTLTKVTGAPSTAVIAATTDTGGIIGITTAGAGTTGNATVTTAGHVNCVFSNATTAGDYVQISSATAGNCADTGAATYPTSGQVIGRVLSTNAAAGTYQIDLFPSEIKAASGSGGGLVVNTTNNCGFYAPDGVLGCFDLANSSSGNTAFALGANVLAVAQFPLAATYQVSKISYDITALSATSGAVCNFSLYTSTGTKVLDSGSINCGSTGTTGVASVTVTTQSLSPGLYYLGWCSTTTDARVVGINWGLGFSIGGAATTTATGILGSAANSCTAGAPPATLGTVTNNTGQSAAEVYFAP